MNKYTLKLIEDCCLKKEAVLDLGKCGLTDIDFRLNSPIVLALQCCSHVETLILSNDWYDDDRKRLISSKNTKADNKFRQIDFRSFDGLAGLTKFICSGGQPKEWGISCIAGIEKLTNLAHLSLTNNDITDIRYISALRKLNFLDLSNNLISDLGALADLKNLEFLDITGNNVSEIEQVIGLPQLAFFFIAKNEIRNISYNAYLKFFTVHSASYLQVARNALAYFYKAGFGEHTSQLSLTNNSVSRALFESHGREEAIFLKNKPTIDNCLLETQLATNPVAVPPLEIVKQGSASVVNWYEAREQGGLINMEGKVILFGNGEAGKTTLVHQLIDNVFLTHTERTHGILVRGWTIPKRMFSAELIEKITQAITRYAIENPRAQALAFPESLQLNLWDFGGQEYYHATHRLFMSSNVLYLLLWDLATDQIDEETGIYPQNYWKRNIEHFSTRNTVLNIQNKVKRVAQKTDGKENFKIVNRDKDSAKSISQYHIDVEDLQTGIFDNIVGLSYIGEPFPRVYDDIKKLLKNIKKDFITYTAYEAICLNADDTVAEVMSDPSQRETLLRFLDDTGTVVSFRYRNTVSSELLNDIIFTDPEWLTGVIYDILSKQVSDFDWAHVDSITSRHQLDTTTWIEIMKQFELIFEIEEDGCLRYIVPQYLPKECLEPKRRKSALVGKQMLHAFTLSYPGFFPNSNFLRFLARFGSKSEDYLYWKNGLVFTQTKTVEALCDSAFTDGKIEIYIQDRDPELAKEIFEVLLAIDEANDLEVSINQKDFVTVRKLKEKIFGNYLSVEATNEITLKLSEFNHLFNIRNARRSVFISYAKEDFLLRDEMAAHLSPFIRQEMIAVWDDDQLKQGLWSDQIEKKLDETDIFILLITKNFCNSDFIATKEIIKAMELFEKGRSKIFPVICEDCAWQYLPVKTGVKEHHPVLNVEMRPWLGQLTAYPRNRVPLDQWEPRSEGFTNVLNSLVPEFAK